MSAGRFEWEAVRFEHVDASGAFLRVTRGAASWMWDVFDHDSMLVTTGLRKTSSAAKGAARKALEMHKKVAHDRALAARVSP